MTELDARDRMDAAWYRYEIFLERRHALPADTPKERAQIQKAEDALYKTYEKAHAAWQRIVAKEKP